MQPRPTLPGWLKLLALLAAFAYLDCLLRF